MRAVPSFESHTVEFKSQWGEKDGQTIKKTLVAFANTAGGEIYIGVNDDGTVCGLENMQKVEESLCSFVRDAVFPSMSSMVTMERLSVEGQNVLCVHVNHGEIPPYSLVQNDPSQVYVRIGCSTVPAGIDDMAEMLQRSNPIPFEERNAGIQELTFEKCLAFCRDP